MRALRQPRLFAAGLNMTRTGLISLFFLAPAILTAQDVPYAAPGPMSKTAALAIYNGKYVILQSDFGFFWLDTNTLTPGHVQAESKCGPWPPSASNYYPAGDCNGVTDVHSSGNVVLVRQLTGNCRSCYYPNCSGSQVAGPAYLLFDLGTWTFTKGTGDIPDSTQTADPQGRTWTIEQVDSTHFIWHASGNPNAPPTNNATATNTSASGRSDKTNYFGDIWTLQDTSTSIATVSQAQWDFRYTAAFAANLTETNPPVTIPGETHSFPFPCDPAGNPAGTISPTGTNCWASVGSPTTTGTYQFALQDTNVNGVTAPFVSSSISVSPPQIQIAGFVGTTLNILTGGNADASQTQGNTANATFNWTFNTVAYNCPAQPCKVAPVPLGTTAFTLQVVYPGGFTTPLARGTVVPADLVPSFTLSPNPVLNGAQLTLTNRMQIGSATTLNSVAYVVKQGSTTISSGTLAASFDVVNGTASVTAPGTTGNYTMQLTYNFSGPLGQNQQQPVSLPFSSTDWAPKPQIVISPVPFCTTTCQIQTGTTYSLSDGESIPITPHPGALWELVNGSGIATTIQSTTDANTLISWTPTSTCNGCALRLTVGTASQSLPVTIASAPPPPPPPPSGPSVTISGPTSLNVGQNGTFTATVTNATGTVSYTWAFDDAPLPQNGGSSIIHSWSSNGSHTVTVAITAGNGNNSASWSVSVVGNPAPSGSFTITPSQVSGTTYSVGRGQTLTFAASEAYASQWGWNFGDNTLAGGPTSRVVQKTYSAFGTYNAQLIVYGDGTHTTGTTMSNFTVVVGVPLPSAAFTISGATQNPITGNYDTEAGRTLVFTASEPNAAGFSWDLGDATSSVGRVVAKTYSSTGVVTVRLTVTGDGTNTSGTNTGTAVLNLAPSTFRAAIVPGVAHLDDGTTTWGTDVSVTNAGSGSMTINLAFVPLLSDQFAPTSMDLTQLSYGSPIQLAAGGSYSASDVVTALNGGNNKGTLVIKYTGGSQAPLVSTRVYFQPETNPGNISYGSSLPAYQVDASGRISPQGFISVALEGTAQTDAVPAGVKAVEETLTVSKAGTGSGTVTSNPSGIDCGATCSASFDLSSYPVTLIGAADPGSQFVGWTGCDLIYLGQCVIQSGSKSVTATFNGSGPPPAGNYLLTVTKNGTGSGSVSSTPTGIDCGSTCSSAFASGTSVTLTATAAPGATFAGWGGACSGTGSCVVTLSTNASVTATFNSSASASQGDQDLIGLRFDSQYRFGVTLFNASGVSGTFRLTAMDEQSSPILISDGTPTPVAYRDFTIRPYQQVYLRSEDLGLTDPNRRYVLKATRTSSGGTLLAFGTALDKRTNDFLQVADDSQASTADAGIVSYWVAGVSRYDTTYGAHWRTDLRIYNRGSHPRNLYFDYVYSTDGQSEHVARIGDTGNYVTINPGQLLTYDDVIASLLSHDTRVDLSGSNSGILHVYYAEDAESATRPLIIGSRNYDDQPTGTAGSQLAVYTKAQAASTGQKLVLAGAEESARYASRIGVFLLDPGPVSFRIVAVAPDGSEVGSLSTQLGGSGLHYGQISLTDLQGFANPNLPVSIRIDQVSGGRVASYAFTVDKVTLDTNFIQGLPQ